MGLELDIAVPLRAFRLELRLAVERETFALIGPSGSGKTTLLRALAGLHRPARGRIVLDGEVLFDAGGGVNVSPERRGIGLVFQDYALFPHLTVEQNVAFARGADPRAELERAGVAHLARALPAQLSGGERQRVALARALARRPRLLLLDEPLAALDPHTRGSVRGSLHTLLQRLELPVVLVTHEFDDAVVLADRVGVLEGGRLVQTGTPTELLAAPENAFVASFAGANVLRGEARPATDGLTEVELPGGERIYASEPAAGPVEIVLYPWEIAISREAPGGSTINHLRAPIGSLIEVGNRTRVHAGPLVAEITSRSARELELRRGDVVVASFKATAARLLPA